jgi:hypothetical protein
VQVSGVNTRMSDRHLYVITHDKKYLHKFMCRGHGKQHASNLTHSNHNDKNIAPYCSRHVALLNGGTTRVGQIAGGTTHGQGAGGTTCAGQRPGVEDAPPEVDVDSRPVLTSGGAVLMPPSSPTPETVGGISMDEGVGPSASGAHEGVASPS